jgi:hypothetical protein
VLSTYSISSDPFADTSTVVATLSHSNSTSHPKPPSVEHTTLRGIETRIHRPFLPTLHDELAVQRGEIVRVLTTFDDGWVIVEKVVSGERGLVPAICLEEEVGDVLPYMASRRVSSVDGCKLGVTGTAGAGAMVV